MYSKNFGSSMKVFFVTYLTIYFWYLPIFKVNIQFGYTCASKMFLCSVFPSLTDIKVHSVTKKPTSTRQTRRVLFSSFRALQKCRFWTKPTFAATMSSGLVPACTHHTRLPSIATHRVGGISAPRDRRPSAESDRLGSAHVLPPRCRGYRRPIDTCYLVANF